MPVQVVFQGMAPAPALDAEARERAERLGEACGLDIACRVVIACRSTPVGLARDYTVHLDVQVSGRDLVAASHQHNADVSLAMRDAFEAVKRQLAERLRRRRLREAHEYGEAKYFAGGGA